MYKLGKISSTNSKRFGQIWVQRPSGILEPAAQVFDISAQSKTNYLEIKGRAEQIERIYKEANIRLPSNSGLGKLIKAAKDLSDNWLLCNKERLNFQMLFSSMHLDRVAEVLLMLKSEPEKEIYLKRLLRGTLDFLEREESKAKNFFWELEVWMQLRKRMRTVYLEEPPDILVDYEDSSIGISCKKLYSEKHVRNVLSEAVEQIERGFEFGIVAINIDDLLPSQAILRMGSSIAVSERLDRVNREFIDRHHKHLAKYLSATRIISAIISVSVIADVPPERLQFRNTNQWTVWTISGIPGRYQSQLNKFYDTVMN